MRENCERKSPAQFLSNVFHCECPTQVTYTAFPVRGTTDLPSRLPDGRLCQMLWIKPINTQPCFERALQHLICWTNLQATFASHCLPSSKNDSCFTNPREITFSFSFDSENRTKEVSFSISGNGPRIIF